MTDVVTKDASQNRLLATILASIATVQALAVAAEALGAPILLRPFQRRLRLRLQLHHPHLLRPRLQHLRHPVRLTAQPRVISWWLMEMVYRSKMEAGPSR